MVAHIVSGNENSMNIIKETFRVDSVLPEKFEDEDSIITAQRGCHYMCKNASFVTRFTQELLRKIESNNFVITVPVAPRGELVCSHGRYDFAFASRIPRGIVVACRDGNERKVL